MNPKPTLTEIIESAIRSVGRIEAILDRMEAREAVMEAALVEQPEPVTVSAPTVTDAPEDPTQRDLPIPPGCPSLPELPEGKTRWVNRGGFDFGMSVPADDRVVFYWSPVDEIWKKTSNFGGCLIHIEAVAEPAAVEPAPEPVKPRLIPEAGNHYFTRNGRTVRIISLSSIGYFRGEVSIGSEWGPFYWHLDGTPFGTGNREWDLVELCPF
jgi:hypothetical protein